jgi:hypothetical protein
MPVKPGTRTSELWITIIAGLLVLTGIADTPDDAEGVVVGVLAAAYALSRGVSKISPTADWSEDPHAVEVPADDVPEAPDAPAPVEPRTVSPPTI